MQVEIPEGTLPYHFVQDRQLAFNLGSTNSCSTAVGRKTYSTLQSSNRQSNIRLRLNSCYCNPDLLLRPLHHSIGQTASASDFDLDIPLHNCVSALQFTPHSEGTCHHCVDALAKEGICSILERHPFSGQIASAGELLHTSQRISTFMTTVPLSLAIYTFKQVLMSAQLDISGTFSVHPASPALLTSKGPHEILYNSSRHILLQPIRDIQEN